jgi:glycerol-3-phosphate acyltransferase PlsY
MSPADIELILLYATALLGGYIVGSIPSGLIITNLAGMGDVRGIGSGNIGATNVLRTGNKKVAAATLLADMGKGAAAVLVFGMFATTPGLVAGLGAVFGHNFPVWLGFKGGKGVATTLGVLFAASWPVGILACLTWLATAFLFRMSSLAGLVALAAAPVFVYFLETEHHVALAVALAVLAFVRHHENICRIFKGEESKIGEKG